MTTPTATASSVFSKPDFTLYEYTHSGNSYKALLTAHLLSIPLHRVFIDITKGESRTPEFLARSSSGQVPLLQLTDGSYLSQSHAIIGFLAHGSDLIPTEQIELAQMQQWMNFEQYNLETAVGVLRYRLFSAGQSQEELGELYQQLLTKGYAALDVLELGLLNNEFLVAKRFTLADIALYAYTHCAEEGTLSLANYPNIQRWIGNVEAIPNFKALHDF